MITTTAQSIEGQPASEYHEMATHAAELGADAVLAVDLDYEVVGSRGSMLMVTCAGTAVKLS